MAELKDSGNRREFETGAVRDMQEGKGRMDLVPWNMASEFRTKLTTLWNIRHIGTEAKDGYYNVVSHRECIQPVLEYMIKMDQLLNPDPNSENALTYVDSRVKMKECLLGMAACFAAYVYNGLPAPIRYDDEINAKEFINGIFANAMLEVSKHYEDGARKYEDNNWRKGIPVKVYFDSASRHFMKWVGDWKDEPHDRAIIWNCLCGAWEADRECTEWAISHAKVEAKEPCNDMRYDAGGPGATGQPLKYCVGSGTTERDHTIQRDQNGNIIGYVGKQATPDSINVLQSFSGWDPKPIDGCKKSDAGSGTSDTKACYRVYRDQNGDPIYD